MQVWASAIAAGISDEVFWRLTPHELEAVLKLRADEEKRERLLFGLVAATVVNVNRRKGARLVHAKDFFRERARPKDFMSAEAAQAFMDSWAQQMNKSHGEA